MAQDLEKVIANKIKPIIDNAIHKYLGITLNELNKTLLDKLMRPLIDIDIDFNLPFEEAKNNFKKVFIKKLLETNYGNISLVAKVSGLERRSIHRVINKFNIDVTKVREDMLNPKYYRNIMVDKAIKESLDLYKEVLHPKKYFEMYDNIDKIRKEFVEDLPINKLTWKEAEKEFEIIYLTKLIENENYILKKAAEKAKIRYETLIRKLNKLKIKHKN